MLDAWLEWSGQSSFCRPTKAKAILQDADLYAKTFRPFRQTERFASEGKANIVPFVSALLFPVGPSAITRFVITVIVNAVEGILIGWARPHVSVEILEASPRVANGNATCPIARVGLRFRVSASLKHLAPGLVFWTPVVAISSHAVRQIEALGPFASEASTAFSGPLFKFFAISLMVVSAIAFADPCFSSCGFPAVGLDCQSAESHPGQIDKLLMFGHRMDFRHARSLESGCVERGRRVTSTSGLSLL